MVFTQSKMTVKYCTTDGHCARKVSFLLCSQHKEHKLPTSTSLQSKVPVLTIHQLYASLVGRAKVVKESVFRGVKTKGQISHNTLIPQCVSPLPSSPRAKKHKTGAPPSLTSANHTLCMQITLTALGPHLQAQMGNCSLLSQSFKHLRQTGFTPDPQEMGGWKTSRSRPMRTAF